MPLNIDSYTTTVGSSIDARRLASAIKEAIITDDLDTQPESRLNIEAYGDFHPLFITGTYPGEEKIPSFAHPISILNIRGKNYICSDLRLFLKKDLGLPISRRITNRVDFDYAVSRTVLNLLWAGGRSTEFTSGFSFSGRVFSEWVSQILRNSLGLEPYEQLTAQVTTLAYYYCLCAPNMFTLEEESQRVVDWIYHLTGISNTEISKIVAKLKPMSTFDDLVDNLKLTLDNIRVQKLTSGGFLAAVRSSWYGTNAVQVLSVCIEHPPTFTAIVYHTLASKGYQRCLIGQVALKAGKRGDADAFMRHYYEMFGQSLRMESVGTSENHVDFQGLMDKAEAEQLAMEAVSRLPLLD